MFWSKKQKPPQQPPTAIVAEKKKPPPDPEQVLSEALAAYEKHYYAKTSKALNQDAEKAKNIVNQAREFVSSSRLGYAACRPILEHVKNWPAWSKHKDFQKYCTEPFRYLGGSTGDSSSKPRTTVVTFSYNSRPYTLKFIDEGMLQWATDDLNTYGKVEIVIENKTVLGLDMSMDLSKGDAAYWRMSDVYALLPGPWMKDVIEMAAYIDGKRQRQHEEFFNKNALDRAAGICLPD